MCNCINVQVPGLWVAENKVWPSRSSRDMNGMLITSVLVYGGASEATFLSVEFVQY